MSDTELVIAADGTPLKKKLAQALFKSRVRAFGLVLPLLIFIVASFIIPIFSLMVQGVKNDTYSSNMPASTAIMAEWDGASEPTEEMFAALVSDLIQAREDKSIGRVATRVNREESGTRSMFTKSARNAAKLEAPFMAAMLDIDEDWGSLDVWGAMKVSSQTYSPAFYAAAVDADYKADGSIVRLDSEDRIYVYLFVKTLTVALAVTLSTLVLGYPVAWLLAGLPIRQSNLLMILVLLPFWTSLLVRTTAWIAMLQSHGGVE